MRLRDFSETFQDDLRDPEFVEGYLQEALSLDTPTFLAALQNVVKANGGVANVARATGRNRESAYKSLSRTGNPRFETVRDILAACGMRLTIAREEPDADKLDRPAASAAGQRHSK